MTWRDRIQAGVEIGLLSRLIPLGHADRLLEIGCGYGNALSALAAVTRARTVIGTDIDETALHTAVEWGNATMFSLVAADATLLPLADNSIDLIVDFGTLYHVRDQPRALKEIQRVLRDGGMLVHETRLAQALAHPSSLKRGGIDWSAAPELQRGASAGLWSARRRTPRTLQV